MVSKRDLTETESAQNQKEVTINDRDQELEDSANAVVSITVTGDFLISNANFMAGVFFDLTDNVSAAFDFKLPSQGSAGDAFSREFVVRNSTDQICTVMVDPDQDGADGATVTIYPGQIAICYSDGTNVIELPGRNGLWTPREISGTSHTFEASDRGKALYSTNASDTVFTIPEFSTTPIAVGAAIRVVQLGAGLLSIDVSGAVTLIAGGISGVPVNLNGFGAGGVLWQYAQDFWLFEGNIA